MHEATLSYIWVINAIFFKLLLYVNTHRNFFRHDLQRVYSNRKLNYKKAALCYISKDK